MAALNFREGTGDFGAQKLADPDALQGLLVETSRTTQSAYNASGNLTQHSVQAIRMGSQQVDSTFTAYTHTFWKLSANLAELRSKRRGLRRT